MTDLASILASLYPDRDRVRVFLLGVNLDPNRINLDGDPIARWGNVLEEAWKHKKVGEVVDAASREYEAWRTELTEAKHRYFDGRDEPAVSAQPPVAPPRLRYYFDQWFPDLHRFLTSIRILPTPPELDEISSYLLKHRANIRKEFRQKTYLPLAGKPLPPTSPIAAELDEDPFVSPMYQVILQITGRAYGGASASPQIVAASRQSRVVRNILRFLDRTKGPVILLGEPGSGKTMTLQQAAMMLAERESRRVFPRVPIYVRLGRFYVEGQVDDDDVWEYVKWSVTELSQRRIDDLEHVGRLVVFFDGMDEMSRERYSEHTEALSVFADRTRAKTLFSCRSTDFSPKFLHQGLVLLPFDRRQVAEYLSRYLERFPVIVNGRSWTLKELVKRILSGELPIELDNPFALWLLCLYLVDKGTWPDSQVEMLRFYNERNYQRNNDKWRKEGLPFPEMEAAFREWARFAYLITERNRGLAIPVHMVEVEQDSATVHEMIRVGDLCGILDESRDNYEGHLIQFDHHRFQEFFAALYIHENRPPIKWLDKLDAPRWQETMLDLILMGGADDVVHTFADAITELTRICRTELGGGFILPDEHETVPADWSIPLPFTPPFTPATWPPADEHETVPAEWSTPLPCAPPTRPPSDEHETVLADRVEMASRIMRQAGASRRWVQETLMPPFREAVTLLAERGNPITQVKMMRACLNFPGIGRVKALEGLLESPVKWVRNQALILRASDRGQAIGSDLPTQIGYDLADGRFPDRLPAYWKAVCAGRNTGYWWSFLAGVCGYVTNVILLFVVAAMLYLGMWLLRDESAHIGFLSFAILGQPASIVISGLVVTVVASAALRIRPSLLWIAITGSTVGIALLLPALLDLSVGSWRGLGTLLLVLVCGGFFAVYSVSALIAFSIHCGILAIYLAVSVRVRQRSLAVDAFLDLVWGNYNTAILKTSLVGAPVFGLLWLFGWWANNLVHAFTDPVYVVLLGIAIVAGILMVIGEICLPIVGGAYQVIINCAHRLREIGIGPLVLEWIKKGLAFVLKTIRLVLLWSLGLGISVLLVVTMGRICFWFGRLLNNLAGLRWQPLLTGFVAIWVTVLIGRLVHAWAKKGFAPSLKDIRSVLLSVLLWGLVVSILVLAIYAVGAVGVSLNNLLDLQWHPGFTAAAAALFMVPIGLLAYSLIEEGKHTRPALLYGLVIAILIGIYVFWSQIGSRIAPICAISIWLSLAIALLAVLRPWAPVLRRGRSDSQRYRSGSFTPEEWKKRIGEAMADEQKSLLYRTDHQSLSLKTSEFLDVLKEIRPVITKEPALSAYWEKRNRVEEELKQERQG